MHSGAAAASMMMNDDDFDVICFSDIHFDTCFIFQISYQLELSYQKQDFLPPFFISVTNFRMKLRQKIIKSSNLSSCVFRGTHFCLSIHGDLL